MPMIKKDGSLLTATALNPNNIWAGSPYEYLGGPSLISIAVITPAAAGGLLSSTTVGGVTIAEEYVVPTDNRGAAAGARSEERRVGKESRARRSRRQCR